MWAIHCKETSLKKHRGMGELVTNLKFNTFVLTSLTDFTCAPPLFIDVY